MILFPAEAEGMVKSLEPIPMEEVGMVRWHKNHEYSEKLNMQAVLSASHQTDEFVKEFLISHDKLNLLISDLISTELWKENIFSELQKMNFEPKVSFPIYAILYHEATLVNILETVLYHSDSMEQVSDTAIDLADYCYRKLCYLVFQMKDRKARQEVMELKCATLSKTVTVSESSMDELLKQNRVIEFDIAIKAISLLRYLIDHLSILPLSVSTRLLNTYDIPVLLVDLVEDPAWVISNARSKGDSNSTIWKYIENGWQSFENRSELCQMSRLDGQLWISLYQLLMTPEYQQKYEINSYRREVLLKLRSYLTDVTLDQMPNLIDFRRYLEYLSMSEPPVVKSDLILEQVPEVRDNLVREYSARWGNLAAKFADWLTSPEAESHLQKQAQVWSDTYSMEALESLITTPPKCAVCGAEAVKRCSRCRNEWYCRRECQIGHWKKHKPACDLMANSVEKTGENV